MEDIISLANENQIYKSAITIIFPIKNTNLNICWPVTGRTH